MNELIFNSFYFGRVLVVLKELISTADPVEWINLINFKKITNILVRLNTCNSSKTELKFVERQAFARFQTWLLPGLRKMLVPQSLSSHQMVSQCWMFPVI